MLKLSLFLLNFRGRRHCSFLCLYDNIRSQSKFAPYFSVRQHTNTGSAYNKYSGMFTAPTDGVYVFTWTILSNGYSFAFTQIVVNSQVITSLVTDSHEINDTHSTTGMVVVSINREGLVFIRTHPTDISLGKILSLETHGRPSFSGWKL